MVPAPIQPGFYVGFIVWGKSPEWPKATSFLGWSGRHTPRKCFEMNMRWDTILRNITVVFYFVFSIGITFIIHVPCHIVSLDREHLLHVHWPRRVWMIFRFSDLQTVMITIFFVGSGGGGGELGIFLWGSFYPSSTLEKTLTTTYLASPTCLKTWDGVP